MSRRDHNDAEWKETRQKVFQRDQHHCRLLRVCTAQEALMLIKFAGNRMGILDPAHIFAVSIAPHMCYDIDNIVTLNRYSHSLLEECKHPIYGTPITKEDEENWWKRIIGEKLYTKLESRRYKEDSSYIIKE